jgi:tryptophan-rich sensory protein
MSKRELLALVGFVVLSFAAAGLGALFTTPAVKAGGWYSQIQKPAWTLGDLRVGAQFHDLAAERVGPSLLG